MPHYSELLRENGELIEVPKPKEGREISIFGTYYSQCERCGMPVKVVVGITIYQDGRILIDYDEHPVHLTDSAWDNCENPVLTISS